MVLGLGNRDRKSEKGEMFLNGKLVLEALDLIFIEFAIRNGGTPFTSV